MSEYELGNRLTKQIAKLQTEIDGNRLVIGVLEKECEGRDAKIAQLQSENERMRAAIKETLEENGHLADGDVCTLLKLKQALEGGE